MTAPAETSSLAGAGSRVLLAIDPGSAKCGLALVSHPPTQVLSRQVVPTPDLVEYAGGFLSAHSNLEILLGRGTGSARVANAIKTAYPQVTLRLVDERDTSRRARERYCRDNPARGFSRLLPAGLRHPESPYDDYVAIILAEDFLQQQETVS